SSQHHVDLLFYSTEPPTPVIYPLSLHDALPIFAGAVVAKVCAEWQVGIQRQWARVGLAAGGRFHHLFDTIIRGELYCRRVGGVAWPAQVVTADQGLIPDKGGQGGCSVAGVGAYRHESSPYICSIWSAQPITADGA